MDRRPTLRDVAAAAEVSVATASVALNFAEGARVAAGTRARIRQEAERLGYRPSSLARGLRMRRTQSVALVSDQIATTPYAGKMILGAQETALHRGWTLLIFNTGDDPRAKRQVIESIERYDVDGTVYGSMFHRVVTIPAELTSRPLTLLDARCSDATIPAVVPDEAAGASAAVNELVAAGHRRIGFANVKDRIPARAGRLAGYRASLKAAGIAFDPSLLGEAENTARGGYAAASRILGRPDRPTGLFCFSDNMAMGVYHAAAELGLKIPTDLSVIGFDNQQHIADSLFPALTTVELPLYEMGRWAVETLLDSIEKPSPHDARRYPELMACTFVRRQSVSAPPTRR